MQNFSQTINHFAHPLPLDLVYVPPYANLPNCSACRTEATGWTYTCSRGGCCGFYIHAWCALLPPVITHPVHFNSCHSLTLLATPTVLFRCDGCGYDRDGFRYRCSAGCNFDLHVFCAARPLTADHRLYRCGTCNFDCHLGCVACASYQSPHPSPSWPQPQPQPGPMPPSLQYGPPTVGGGIYSQPPSAVPSLVGAVAQGVIQGVIQLVLQNLTSGFPS